MWSSSLVMDIKGKQKIGSDIPWDFSNGININNDDIRIPIGSAPLLVDAEEATISREELRRVWTPEPSLVPDDRVRRSSLWNSALEVSDDLRIFSEDSIFDINEDLCKDLLVGKIDKEIGAKKKTDEIKLDNQQLILSSQSIADPSTRVYRQSSLELSETNSVESSDVEESQKKLQNVIKLWSHKPNKRRNSMAERLSNLLRPRPKLAEKEVEAKTNEQTKLLEADQVLQAPQIPSKFKKSITERVPPEWVVLLFGCIIGLSSGISVVIFNKGVHFIHNLAWAGTPEEGASWLRQQKLVDIWHRTLMIPVVGGILVGMFHSIVDVLDIIRATQQHSPKASNSNKIDWLGALKQIIKAFQAALTLGTGSSLGPEGPSVDIGKSWAHGFSNVMKNSKERRIALVAAGAAAGIASGFNAPVAGTFFAIETVLKPQHEENSPPLTTAMIILAAVISSTVTQILLDEKVAFTVPPYELRSATELPLYIILGGICGVLSVTFTRLVEWFTSIFDRLKRQLGVPASVTPAIGALLTGIIALKYPGVLYWGFTNVDEILNASFTTTTLGKGLLTQLTIAKIVATALCKGSGLVGGLYAPSLFIGSSVGAIYGSIVAEAINKISSSDTAAHPQAYALVGMAGLLASMCSVPLTSVLLLFELTKDYRILLPLMGAVGLAIWVAAIHKKIFAQTINQHGILGQSSNTLSMSQRVWRLFRGTADVKSPSGRVWRRVEGKGSQLELVILKNDEDSVGVYIYDEVLMNECQTADAMSMDFVRVNAMTTVKESIGAMLVGGQRYAFVVDENDLLEGIMSSSDLQREVFRAVEESVSYVDPITVKTDAILVAAICTSNIENVSKIVVCYPDTSLQAAKELMQLHSLPQLPVITRVGKQWQERGHKMVGVLHKETIPHFITTEASKRIAALIAQKAKDEDFSPVTEAAH